MGSGIVLKGIAVNSGASSSGGGGVTPADLERKADKYYPGGEFVAVPLNNAPDGAELAGTTLTLTAALTPAAVQQAPAGSNGTVFPFTMPWGLAAICVETYEGEEVPLSQYSEGDNMIHYILNLQPVTAEMLIAAGAGVSGTNTVLVMQWGSSTEVGGNNQLLIAKPVSTDIYKAFHDQNYGTVHWTSGYILLPSLELLEQKISTANAGTFTWTFERNYLATTNLALTTSLRIILNKVDNTEWTLTAEKRVDGELVDQTVLAKCEEGVPDIAYDQYSIGYYYDRRYTADDDGAHMVGEAIFVQQRYVLNDTVMVMRIPYMVGSEIHEVEYPLRSAAAGGGGESSFTLADISAAGWVVGEPGDDGAAPIREAITVQTDEVLKRLVYNPFFLEYMRDEKRPKTENHFTVLCDAESKYYETFTLPAEIGPYSASEARTLEWFDKITYPQPQTTVDCEYNYNQIQTIIAGTPRIDQLVLSTSTQDYIRLTILPDTDWLTDGDVGIVSLIRLRKMLILDIHMTLLNKVSMDGVSDRSYMVSVENAPEWAYSTVRAGTSYPDYVFVNPIRLANQPNLPKVSVITRIHKVAGEPMQWTFSTAYRGQTVTPPITEGVVELQIHGTVYMPLTI